MNDQRVVDFYTAQVRKEWRRLIKDAYHRVEFETTLHFLEKYFPDKGRVLDAGGGPGRYTIELARRGYRMVLLDMTPANLKFAQRQIQRAGFKESVEAVVEGSIIDLSRFPEAGYDAVICLGGPLSHVLDAGDRKRAIGELVRVARPGAPVAISVMSRLALLVLELEFQDEITMPHFEQIRDCGDYEGSSGFTACHFFLPEELQAAFQRPDVEILEMVGLEGLSANHTRPVNHLAKNPERWKVWMETHLRTCTHPAVVGMSEHMLLVCRKLPPA